MPKDDEGRPVTGKRRRVIVELIASDPGAAFEIADALAEQGGFVLDREFAPVAINHRDKRRLRAGMERTYVVRGEIEIARESELEDYAGVYHIWSDPGIALFKCCGYGRKGNAKRAALCIGAEQVWRHDHTGSGIVIGIVDEGIDRTVFSNTVDGSFPGWGTIPGADSHGNMCAFDATAMAPDVALYDMAISRGVPTIPDVLSNAILAYDWARTRFLADGTPHILSNSWGIFEESWATDYATDPNHPFTILVGELIDLGVKVLFAAGNCGNPCPDGRCGTDRGPGQDIWGANGLEEVMTVGGVKLSLKRASYSSQGPAALFPDKPDFCGYTQFRGHTANDNGTSAACPVVAGCVALLLSYDDTLSQAKVRQLLADTARDLTPGGFDRDTGAGLVQVDEAFYNLEPGLRPSRAWRDKLCDWREETELRCREWQMQTRQECAQWADQGTQECAEWADQGQNECAEWRDQGYQNCSGWHKWLSWLCFGWYWVSSWVCVSWYWVANLVCVVYHWVANLVCVLFTTIVTWLCLLWVRIVTGITLTNCKCR